MVNKTPKIILWYEPPKRQKTFRKLNEICSKIKRKIKTKQKN